MKYFSIVLFIIISFVIDNKAFGNIIIDAETEDVVREISNPIFRIANIKNPQIYIINNPTPNAYTDGNERIYIHSGLISLFPDPEVLRGVIAHEVGHITSRHVARTMDRINEESKSTISSMIIGTIASIALLNPAPFVYGSIVGHHTAEKSILKYSRENETVADQKAEKYLKELGYNQKGLIKLLEYFHAKTIQYNEFRYDMTHPLNSERISLLRSYKPIHLKNENPKLIEKFQFVSAKLIALSNSSDFRYLSEDAKTYGRAILFFLKSDKTNALININKLLQKYPNNPYFIEMKAEILTKFGDESGISLYSKAYSIKKNPIFKIEESISKIILLKSESDLNPAIAFLELQLKNLDNNITIINFLSIAYDKIGKNEYALYYRALAHTKEGKKTQAIKFANSAKLLARHNKQLLVKIEDLIYSLD